jgi:predicted secreted protein
MRRLLAVPFLCWMSGGLFAADAAEREVIGFSADGRFFAFEQFGVQDGSGFPYSDIFIIDAEKDAWQPGTPIRVMLQEERATVAAARLQAAENARPIVSSLKIEEPGIVLASQSSYQSGSDPQKLAFRNSYVPTDPAEDDDVTTVTLEEIVLAGPPKCPAGDLPYAGFTISIKPSGSAQFTTVHRDKEIPASRVCPLKYSLSDIIGFRPTIDGPVRLVALVSVYSYGFEGMDRRFVAVTLQ